MIKWIGKSTDGRWRREVEAESYLSLMEILIDKGYISDYRLQGEQLYYELCYVSDRLDKLDKRLNSECESVALKAEQELENLDWYEEIFHDLSDKEVEGAIRGCNSQAYYQEFIVG